MKRIVLHMVVFILPVLLVGGIVARANTLLFIGSTVAPVVSPVNGATVHQG